MVALGGSFAFWDAAILVLTVLAQFMLDTKVIETWAVWTLVNIVGVVIYFQSELYFAAIQQLIFGVANLWGFLAWRKSMREDAMKAHPSNGYYHTPAKPYTVTIDGKQVYDSSKVTFDFKSKP